MRDNSYRIGNFEHGPVHLLVLQHQHAEKGHGNLPVTHTYTSNERRPIRSVHAKRSPPDGCVQTPYLVPMEFQVSEYAT
jgi:hypothetical protein